MSAPCHLCQWVSLDSSLRFDKSHLTSLSTKLDTTSASRACSDISITLKKPCEQIAASLHQSSPKTFSKADVGSSTKAFEDHLNFWIHKKTYKLYTQWSVASMTAAELAPELSLDSWAIRDSSKATCNHACFSKFSYPWDTCFSCPLWRPAVTTSTHILAIRTLKVTALYNQAGSKGTEDCKALNVATTRDTSGASSTSKTCESQNHLELSIQLQAAARSCLIPVNWATAPFAGQAPSRWRRPSCHTTNIYLARACDTEPFELPNFGTKAAVQVSEFLSQCARYDSLQVSGFWFLLVSCPLLGITSDSSSFSHM